MLYILRGIVGSGKSTFAKSLNIYHVEADFFHMRNSKYDWKPENMKNAHEWCYNQVVQALTFGMDVVVSNTFTQVWEFQKYIDFCESFVPKIPYTVIACKNDYRNIHNVPVDTIQKMKERWEDYDGEELYNNSDPDSYYYLDKH